LAATVMVRCSREATGRLPWSRCTVMVEPPEVTVRLTAGPGTLLGEAVNVFRALGALVPLGAGAVVADDGGGVGVGVVEVGLAEGANTGTGAVVCCLAAVLVQPATSVVTATSRTPTGKPLRWTFNAPPPLPISHFAGSSRSLADIQNTREGGRQRRVTAPEPRLPCRSYGARVAPE
jgi:hypothetical protein